MKLSDKNRQFLFYVLVVIGAVILTFASLHFIHLLDKPIPDSVQTQLWIFSGIALSIAIQLAREYMARPARQQTQDKLDQTQQIVTQLDKTVRDGFQDRVAEKTADKVIEKLQDGNNHDIPNA